MWKSATVALAIFSTAAALSSSALAGGDLFAIPQVCASYGQSGDLVPADDGAPSPDGIWWMDDDRLEGWEFSCGITGQGDGYLSLNCASEGEEYEDRKTISGSGDERTVQGERLVRCAGIAVPQSAAATKDTPFGRVTPEEFSFKCVECFNEAQQMGRSVGGYCPVDCVDVFTDMVCDNQGRCRAGP